MIKKCCLLAIFLFSCKIFFGQVIEIEDIPPVSSSNHPSTYEERVAYHKAHPEDWMNNQELGRIYCKKNNADSAFYFFNLFWNNVYVCSDLSGTFRYAISSYYFPALLEKKEFGDTLMSGLNRCGYLRPHFSDSSVAKKIILLFAEHTYHWRQVNQLNGEGTDWYDPKNKEKIDAYEKASGKVLKKIITTFKTVKHLPVTESDEVLAELILHLFRETNYNALHQNIRELEKLIIEHGMDKIKFASMVDDNARIYKKESFYGTPKKKLADSDNLQVNENRRRLNLPELP